MGANNEAILEAIDDLRSQEVPNVRATARKHEIVQPTLQRRFNHQTVSYAEARSRSTMLLTNAQESVLVEHINKLCARGMHPTPQIVESLVVEIVGHSIGERWVERFCNRYKNELKSVYLRSIDQSRHVADNSKHFQHYFDQVSCHGPLGIVQVLYGRPMGLGLNRRGVSRTR